MRNTFLIIAGLFLWSSILSAQNNRFGIKSGIAISNFSGQESDIDNISIDWGGRSSLQAGFFYNIRIPESLLSFQVELDYKVTGTSFFIADVVPNTNPSTKANYEFEYIGFSVLPRIDLFPKNTLNPNFMFGLLFEHRIDSELIISSSSQNGLLRDGFFGGNINHHTNKNLFGYTMAGGIEINTKPVIITIEARYSSLITPVFGESVENLPFNDNNYLLKLMGDSRNQYFSILTGFNFYF